MISISHWGMFEEPDHDAWCRIAELQRRVTEALVLRGIFR